MNVDDNLAGTFKCL